MRLITRLFIALAALGTTLAGATPARAQQRDLESYLPQARRLMKRWPFIDSHNDLPEMVAVRASGDLSKFDPNTSLPSIDTDIPRLRRGGVGAQFWAAYVPSGYEGRGAARRATEQIDIIKRMIDRSAALRFATTADEIERIHGSGRIASLIGIEGGHAIESSLGLLRQYHALGVRYMTLTHGSTIAWADASTDSARHGGLTRFGEEVVREMNRLGMMVDISHVSDGTMSDVARVSEAPLFFSHSSARAIADHPRNVPDSVLALVKRKGGVVMINAYPAFVTNEAAQKMKNVFEVERALRTKYPNDQRRQDSAFIAYINGPDIPRGTLAQYVDHIDHVVKVAGVEHVGIGADMGSIAIHPDGLEDVSRFPYVVAELLRRGYGEQQLRLIMGGNLLRTMRETERVARRLQRTRHPSAATIAALDSTKTVP
jgi:membrane dipeptidase